MALDSLALPYYLVLTGTGLVGAPSIARRPMRFAFPAIFPDHVPVLSTAFARGCQINCTFGIRIQSVVPHDVLP